MRIEIEKTLDNFKRDKELKTIAGITIMNKAQGVIEALEWVLSEEE